MKKRIILSALSFILSCSALTYADIAANLTIENKTNDFMSILVNQTVEGVSIPNQSTVEIPYTVVNLLCIGSQDDCLADFYNPAGELAGSATLNSQTGELKEYSAYAPYGVLLDPNEIPLEFVTIVIAE